LETVLANELVASLIQVFETLEDVRAEESSLVVYYRALAIMAFLCFEVDVERDQSVRMRNQFLSCHQCRRSVEHAADI
jgi:hypothetical protein